MSVAIQIENHATPVIIINNPIPEANQIIIKATPVAIQIETMPPQ